MVFKLDYDNLIFLDAEDLAEGGIKAAYESLLPKLRELVPHATPIEEVIDDSTPSYAVRYGDRTFAIYAPELDDGDGRSWGRATQALFAIVNDQLRDSTHRLFAINGGNDLGGMLLTIAESEAARQSLPRKTDWPYLPDDNHPWYGQYHD